MLTSCVSYAVPGARNPDGSYTPNHAADVLFTVTKGKVSVNPSETDRGLNYWDYTKLPMSQSLSSDSFILSAGDSYIYSLKGNHTVSFSVIPLNDEETAFSVTYKGNTKNYSISSETSHTATFINLSN